MTKKIGFSGEASENSDVHKMFHLPVPEASMVSKKRFPKCLETDATMQLDIVPETPVESRNQRQKTYIQLQIQYYTK